MLTITNLEPYEIITVHIEDNKWIDLDLEKHVKSYEGNHCNKVQIVDKKIE